MRAEIEIPLCGDHLVLMPYGVCLRGVSTNKSWLQEHSWGLLCGRYHLQFHVLEGRTGLLVLWSCGFERMPISDSSAAMGV